MDRESTLMGMLTSIAPTTRRSFLKRSIAMGAAVPAFGALLAACGGDDDDDDSSENGSGSESTAGPTATVNRSVPTAGAAGQDTPTSADAESTGGEAEPTGSEAESTETEATAEPTGSSGSDGEPVQGGVFIAMGHHEVASLSPDDWGPDVHYFIVANIHDMLLRLDNYYTLQPSMCESFDIAEDSLTYTFKIRDGLTWHDDSPFTASDVAYTFDYYGTPDNAAATLSDYAGIASVEAPDDLTFTIHMEQPNAALLTRAGQVGIVQEAHHSEIGEDAYKADPIGSGPWVLKEWRAAEYTELTAFENYWSGSPHMDGIRENIVPEASVRAIALENGEADTSVWPLVTDDHLRFLNDDSLSDFTVQRTSSVGVNHFPLNNTNPKFQDKRVRQAMLFAINRESIRDDLWQGLAVLATSNLSPAIDFYYEPDVAQYSYDPEKAGSLLDEAGWTLNDDGIREKDGETLSWTCTIITGDQARRPEAELVQANFKDVGLDMQIEEAPVASIQEGERSGDIDMSLYNWTYGGGSGEPDASNTLKSDARNNWSLYSNPDLDELLDQGLVETDADARRDIYSQIQKIVAEEVPFLFIKYWDWFNIFSPRTKGLPKDPLVASQQYMWLHTMWLDDKS